MTDFSEWIGREDVRADRLDAARSAVLTAALGEPAPLAPGDVMPPLHHWIHFWEARTPADTGPDGHPRKGGFLPPVPLPRRMWAGGRLRFLQPLHLGDAVERRSTIKSIEHKSGKSGDLVFVTVAHQVSSAGGLAIEEEQDLVYRAPGPASGPLPPETPGAPGKDAVDPDAVLLFRYSALTMNSHRIHYDLPYATGEEGYPALVVQGPLQATLLARLALRELGSLSLFSFRGVAPAFLGRRIELHAEPGADGLTLRAEQDGRTTMTATAA